MGKNLETADLIAKLVLATGTLILFFFEVIAGPFARLLVIVSLIIIVLFLVKLIAARLKSRRL